MELSVSKILNEKGIAHKIIELEREAFTVDDVKKFSKGEINADEICKTIVLQGKKSGKMLAVLLRGSDRLDFASAKRILGEEMKVAVPADVKKVAGVDPGAVCPFLLEVPLFVDKRVFPLKKINCGSGHHLYGLEFKVDDLGKAVKYEFVEIAKNNSL